MLVDDVRLEGLSPPESEDQQRNTPYALVAVRLDPSHLRCSLSRLTAQVALSSSSQSKHFSLFRLPLHSSEQRGVSVFDVVQFYGPCLVSVQVCQETLLRKKTVASTSVSLREVLRSQRESVEKADSVYWGFTHRLFLESGAETEYVDVSMRYIEVRHCILSEEIRARQMMQRTELQLCVSLGSPRLMRAMLLTLSRFGFLREALGLKFHHKLRVLDLALLAGREGCVRELLQRCGSLCFQSTAAETSSALHHAVAGGSLECLRLLLRFLRRYGTSTVIGWDGTFADMVDWVDEGGYTPLHGKPYIILFHLDERRSGLQGREDRPGAGVASERCECGSGEHEELEDRDHARR